MSKETGTFLLFSTIMSLVMSGGMSLVMALITVGLTEALATWPMAWVTSFLVALPLSLLVVPVTKRGVNSIVQRLVRSHWLLQRDKVTNTKTDYPTRQPNHTDRSFTASSQRDNNHGK